MRVRTPSFLTLDSDVEFLVSGWLTDMLDLMVGEGLDALGVHEPGFQGYRPRLAPYVLLLRTTTFQALGASFQPFVRVADAEEARRWQAWPCGFRVEFEEIASYRTEAFYPTAVYLFERLRESGARWRDLPGAIAAKFRHLGHTSWAPVYPDTGRAPRADDSAGEQAARLAYVQERLRGYATDTTTSVPHPWRSCRGRCSSPHGHEGDASRASPAGQGAHRWAEGQQPGEASVNVSTAESLACRPIMPVRSPAYHPAPRRWGSPITFCPPIPVESGQAPHGLSRRVRAGVYLGQLGGEPGSRISIVHVLITFPGPPAEARGGAAEEIGPPRAEGRDRTTDSAGRGRGRA